MAGKSHRKTNSSTKRVRVSHTDKLRSLTKRGISVDPSNPRAVSRKYREAQGIPPRGERRAAADLVRDAKEHGFRTTKQGVVVDGPRDRKRNPIKGSRVRVYKGGVVTMSAGARRDYVYGFTKKEKREFAKDPEAFQKKKLRELRERFPILKASRKPQVRLQWGSYQATKDFAPSYFTKTYFASLSPEDVRREGKKHAKPRVDKLTGLHIVVHIPARSKARKTRKGKRRHGSKKK